MRVVLVSCLALSACAGYQTEDDVVDDDPRVCDRSVRLAGGSAQGTPIGLGTIGAEGVSVCVHLDGAAGQFTASTAQEDGASSSFDLVLLDRDGGELRAGWDVTIGAAAPRSFASVEWQPDGAEAIDVIVRVTARTVAPAATTLRVALFDPLD